uniref:VWFA domain-containing protein n=1 Tax=Panagrolaimus sp. ES5 TaxID=591445 RepID=A0AC34GJX0_9BILA
KVHLSKNVEICFLVDATGSMQEHIDGVRESINTIVDLLTLPMPAEKSRTVADEIRLSFVAYRDFGDRDQFKILNFTKSVNEFKEFCANLKATGGGDACEDVFGGLDKALNLSWSDDCGTKLIFHICDAPGHGKKYYDLPSDCSLASYDNRSDHLFEKDEEFYFNILFHKKIDYYFGKINSYTDKMIKVFSDAYPSEIIQ